MCLLLLTQNWMLVDGSFIACISLLVLQDQNNSLPRRTNSQFRGKQFAWTAVGQSSDEGPWRINCQEEKSTRLGLPIGHHFPLRIPIYRQKWQIPLTQTLALMEPPRTHHMSWTNQQHPFQKITACSKNTFQIINHGNRPMCGGCILLPHTLLPWAIF